MVPSWTFEAEYYSKSISYDHQIVKNPANSRGFLLHAHDVCELIFLKSGNVSGIISGKTYKLTKYSLMIFRSHIPHRIQINDNTTYDRYNILFDEKILANGAFYKLPRETDLINFNGNNYVIDLFKKMDYYCINFKGEDLNILIKNLIEELLYNLTIAPGNEYNKNLIATHPTITRAVEFIDNHYTEDISVDDISKRLGITKSHLHHLFVQNIALSPKKLINIKRLSQAQKLIKMGSNPSDVYLSCGFNDYTTFFRNYKSYFGYTPSDEINRTHTRRVEF